MTWTENIGLASSAVERPRLFVLLDRGASSPVTLIAAPAGSGKTMLLSSWLRARPPAAAVAWVGVEREESDATRFWARVMDALRASGALAADNPLATLVPSPHAGLDELVGRLADGLGRLPAPVLLILDDLHELRSEEALDSLERLIARAPAQLRTFILSRRDPKLGLHRLRLSGELTEIRAADLVFTAEEATELLVAAGVSLAEADLARLHGRTEGWAAGLRLAAMSLAHSDDPARFVAEFSGSERTVADYLLAEVLASQPPELRRLLLRTCILERVNGPLADLLTASSHGTRLLHELEESNALVVALDAGRSWFRYHHLFVDLLRLELRREAPEEIEELHRLAAGWLAENGHFVEAIRHAQLAADWAEAAELLGRHWVELVIDGEEATLGALLAGLPARLTNTDAEVAAITAADRLAQSRWSEADALLGTAQTALAELPPARRGRAETALATVQLLRARRIGDLDGAVDKAREVLRPEGAAADPGDAELKALALLNLGIAESWTLRFEDAEAHTEQALALSRKIGRPYIEMGCLATLGGVANVTDRLDLAEEVLRRAIAIAERVGWTTQGFAGVAATTLAAVLVDRGSFSEGEHWCESAAPVLATAPEPAASVGLRHVEGMLHVARGRLEDALIAFRDEQRLTETLRAPHYLAIVARQWELRTQLQLGDVAAVEAALADAGAAASQIVQWCSLAARVRLAADEPEPAAAALAPALSGRAYAFHVNQEIEAYLLDALARERMGEHEAAYTSLERALELAEPQGRVWTALTVPGVRALLESHPAHRTAHGSHLALLLDHLSGAEPVREPASQLSEPLSERELTVLRFLPTNLSAAEIGGELFLSVHTVKTHMRKLYSKLDAHTRAEAVQHGRALGLLAPARRVR